MNSDPFDRHDPAAADPPSGVAPEAEVGEGSAVLDATEEEAASSSSAAAVGEPQRSGRAFWKELPVLIVVALVVAVLIKTFLVQAFFIPSASMRDTLVEGDRVMVNKLAFRFGEPERGDVIVFDSPLETGSDGENILGAIVRNVAEALGLSTPDTALIKRVVAVEGDTIEIRDNRLIVNGAIVDEPYVTRPVRMANFGPLQVPPEHVFVMGDNRNQSEDSRRFGPVPVADVVGRAFIRVWPPSRWGGI